MSYSVIPPDKPTILFLTQAEYQEAPTETALDVDALIVRTLDSQAVIKNRQGGAGARFHVDAKPEEIRDRFFDGYEVIVGLESWRKRAEATNPDPSLTLTSTEHLLITPQVEHLHSVLVVAFRNLSTRDVLVTVANALAQVEAERELQDAGRLRGTE